MAKKSILQRQIKRELLVSKYSEKRKQILDKLKSIKYITSLEEIFKFNKQLQKLPRNSSCNRLRNRCWKTGRSRGFIRYFGLCRNAFRELAHNGFIPGVIKASW